METYTVTYEAIAGVQTVTVTAQSEEDAARQVKARIWGRVTGVRREEVAA